MSNPSEVLVELPIWRTFNLWKNCENYARFMRGVQTARRVISKTPLAQRFECANANNEKWTCQTTFNNSDYSIEWVTQGFPGTDHRVCIKLRNGEGLSETLMAATIGPIDPLNSQYTGLLQRAFNGDLRRFRDKANLGELVEAKPHLPAPNESDSNALQLLFSQLATEWREETGALSFISMRAMHPAYDQIIDLGWPAVPLILRELEDRPDHWTWALKAIVGYEPGPTTTYFNEARLAWLDWGKREGYLSS